MKRFVCSLVVVLLVVVLLVVVLLVIPCFAMAADEGTSKLLPDARSTDMIPVQTVVGGGKAGRGMIQVQSIIDLISSLIASGQVPGLEDYITNTLGIEPGATADMTAAEMIAAIDAYYGSTDWRTGGTGGSDSFAALGCSLTGEIPYYDAGAWTCVDINTVVDVTDTLEALTCNTSEVASWNGAAWACLDVSTGITALQSALTAHATNTENPHGVTYAQVGADAAGAAAAVQTNLDNHTGNTTNPHSVTPVQIGLGNVDDTADADKPISTAQQAALDAKLNANLISSLALTLLDDTTLAGMRVTLGLGAASLLGTAPVIGNPVIYVDDGSGNPAAPLDVPGSFIEDAGGYFPTDTIEAALQYLGANSGGGSGDITAVLAGLGISVTGGDTGDATVAIDPTYTQRRVSSSCTAGSSIRAIAIDGTVTCEVDDTAAGAGYVATPPTYSDEACTAGQYAVGGGFKYECDPATLTWGFKTALTAWSNPAPASYPTLSSAAIGTDGTTLTLGWSTTVSQGSGYADSQLDLDASTTGNNISLTYSSGDGTATWLYTAGSTIQGGETIDLDFDGTADSIENSGGDDLQAIVSASVTNNSTQSSAITCTGDRVLYWPMESTTDVTAGGGCSAGTTTAVLNESPSLSATYKTSGSTSLQINATYENAKLTVSSRDIFNEAAGTITADVWFGGLSDQRVVYGRFDANTAVILQVDATGHLALDYRVEGQTTVTVTSAVALSTGTKYNVIAKWRQGTSGEDSLYISVNGETAVTSNTVLSSWGGVAPAYIHVGTEFGHNENLYIDDLQVYTAWQ